jgi:hypothetical protein
VQEAHASPAHEMAYYYFLLGALLDSSGIATAVEKRYQISGCCNDHVVSIPWVGMPVSSTPFGFILAVRIHAPSKRQLLHPLDF